MVLTEEGYITLSGTTPTYYYYLKDHQGNNRVVINQGGAVQQVNHYYPFGGVFGEGLQTSGQPYKYNGKELDTKIGLNMYDYGARHYDAALGRWFTVDPLAEKYYGISPYVYCANNPVKYVDPNGKWIESVWDVISLATGASSFVDNVKQGKAGAAIVDGLGVVVDAAAVVLPVVPGGAGAAIKATRAVDKVIDGTSVAKDAKKVAKYSDVPNPKKIGEGKSTTPTQRKNILEENKQQNNGELRSDGDGRKLNPPSKNVKGQKADMNQAEVDHIDPKSKGGSNDNSNLQVLSKEENLKKGNR